MTIRRRIQLVSAALAFLAGSVSASVSVVNGLTQEKEAKPGETYENMVVLKNIGKELAAVRLYQTDYSFTADGSKFYDPPGTVKRSNAAWITLGQKRITLAPLGQSEIRFTVRVPAQNGLAGTYWSMIMVEETPTGAAAVAGQKNKVSFGILEVMRSGIQIVTHIGASGTREVKFLKTELLRKGPAKSLAIDVLNTGERWLRPFLTIDLVDVKGVSLGRFDGGRWRLFPGTSVRYVVDFGKIPDGRYQAFVVLDNKDESVFGAQYTLNFIPPAAPAAPAKKNKYPR